MNDKTAVLDRLMRRQRNRKIRNVILVAAAAGLIGWVLTYSQEQAFSLTPPTPGETAKESAAPTADETTTDHD